MITVPFCLNFAGRAIRHLLSWLHKKTKHVQNHENAEDDWEKFETSQFVCSPPKTKINIIYQFFITCYEIACLLQLELIPAEEGLLGWNIHLKKPVIDILKFMNSQALLNSFQTIYVAGPNRVFVVLKLHKQHIWVVPLVDPLWVFYEG